MYQKEKRESWGHFVQTGRVSDYLQYRQTQTNQESNPRRRVSESSKYKQFY